MRLHVAVTCVLSFAVSAYCGSVLATCTGNNAGTISTTTGTSCAVGQFGNLYGTSNATASGSYLISGNVVTVNGAAASTTVEAENPPFDPYVGYSAQATVTVAFSVFVPGSGTGFMVISRPMGSSGVGAGDGNFASESASFGPFSEGCAGNDDGPDCDVYRDPQPITLGTVFEFTETVSASTGYIPLDGGESGSAQVSGTFTFFGADGATPVDVTEVSTPLIPTPEPAELGLLAIGFIAIAAKPLKRFVSSKV